MATIFIYQNTEENKIPNAPSDTMSTDRLGGNVNASRLQRSSDLFAILAILRPLLNLGSMLLSVVLFAGHFRVIISLRPA